MDGEHEKAVRYALKLLGYRQRSVKELGDRLGQKGFDRESVGKALDYLGGLGFLDDGALAHSLRHSAEVVKLLGGAGARQYLLRRGIPREEAERALEGYDEVSSARRLVEKKLRTMKGLGEADRKRRLLGHLRRRGYSGEAIRKSMRTLKEDGVDE